MNDGFTLLELLITLSVLALVISLMFFLGSGFSDNYVLSSEANILAGAVIKARNQAMNNLNESNHGVYLGGSDYVIFQGNSYASRDTGYDEVARADSRVSRSGLAEIVFTQLNGITNAAGDISLNYNNRSAVISINNEGRINW